MSALSSSSNSQDLELLGTFIHTKVPAAVDALMTKVYTFLPFPRGEGAAKIISPQIAEGRHSASPAAHDCNCCLSKCRRAPEMCPVFPTIQSQFQHLDHQLRHVQQGILESLFTSMQTPLRFYDITTRMQLQWAKKLLEQVVVAVADEDESKLIRPSSSSCVVCTNQTAVCRFQPCGHLVACIECTMRLVLCSIPGLSEKMFRHLFLVDHHYDSGVVTTEDRSILLVGMLEEYILYCQQINRDDEDVPPSSTSSFIPALKCHCCHGDVDGIVSS
jgi:hypothetical protein